MTLAVLIPAYNEAPVIRRSLFSCFRAGIKRDDIYVVDDGSKDETATVAAHYHVNVLTKANAGKALALETGMVHFGIAGRYSHVMILDADSALSAAYLPAMHKAVQAHPNGVLFSSVQQSERPKRWNVLTAYRAMEYTVYGGTVREAQHLTGTIAIVPGPGSLFRSEIFAGLEFKNLSLIEDIEWTCILQRRGLGGHIWYVPDAVVLTQDPHTLKDFCGQLMRWNRGIWQVIKKYRLGRGSQRIDVDWAWTLTEQCVLSTLFLVLIPVWFWVSWRTELVWLAIDQVLLLTYAGLTAWRQRRWDIVVFAPAFFFLRCLGWFLFMRAFLLERRATETKWYAVTRYN